MTPVSSVEAAIDPSALYAVIGADARPGGRRSEPMPNREYARHQ
jgi:hypothetical protein